MMKAFWFICGVLGLLFVGLLFLAAFLNRDSATVWGVINGSIFSFAIGAMSIKNIRDGWRQ